MIGYIVGTVFAFAAMICIYYGMFGMTIRKEWNYISIVGSVLLFMCIGCYVALVKNNHSDLFIRELIICIGSILLINERWKVRIIALLPAYIIYSLIDNITILCWQNFGMIDAIQFFQNQNIWLDTGVHAINFFVLLLCALIGRKRLNAVYRLFTWKSYILLILTMLGAVVLLMMVSYSIFGDDVRSYIILQGLLFPTIYVCISEIAFVLYLIELLNLQEKQKENYRLLEKKSLLQEQYYKKMYAKTEELKQFRHDYHHHLNCLKRQIESGDNKGALQYIEQLGYISKNQKRQRIIFSGNKMIDAIICGIIPICESERIEMHYQGKVKEKLYIKDVDLCAVLANALENAIEACQKLKGNRYIDIHLAAYQNALVIRIRNSCIEKWNKSQKRYATNKEDYENHGYGLTNMINIVNSYNGEMEISGLDGEFIVNILMFEMEQE